MERYDFICGDAGKIDALVPVGEELSIPLKLTDLLL
jgi:hypothetical protein